MMNYLIEIYIYITGVAWYWVKIVYNNIIDIIWCDKRKSPVDISTIAISTRESLRTN